MTMIHLPAALAGALLLAAAVFKALNARPVMAAAEGMGLAALPASLARPALAGFVAVQAALGGGLAVGIGVGWLPGAAVAATLLPFVLSQTARWRGRIEDCGCYGVPWLGARGALALDIVLLALLVAATFADGARPPLAPQGPWPVVAALAIGALAGSAALASLRRGALVDLTPLRPGRRWRAEWLAGETVADETVEGAWDPVLYVFLSQGCGLCRSWIKVLTARARLGDFPPVVLVRPRGGGHDEAAFPAIDIPKERLLMLADSLPTAVLVEGGRIAGKWTGAMPEAWLSPLRSGRVSGEPNINAG